MRPGPKTAPARAREMRKKSGVPVAAERRSKDCVSGHATAAEHERETEDRSHRIAPSGLYLGDDMSRSAARFEPFAQIADEVLEPLIHCLLPVV